MFKEKQVLTAMQSILTEIITCLIDSDINDHKKYNIEEDQQI